MILTILKIAGLVLIGVVVICLFVFMCAAMGAVMVMAARGEFPAEEEKKPEEMTDGDHEA